MSDQVTQPVGIANVVATPETPTTPPPTAKSDDDLAGKFHVLSKRERELSLREKKLSDAATQYKPYEELKASAKNNPMAVLEHFGLTIDEITDYVLRGSDPQEMRFTELQKQIESMKAEKENEAKAAKEAREGEAVTEYKYGIAQSIDPDKHELVKHFNAVDTVYDLIKEYYETKGEMLEITTALDWVEQHLEDTMLNPIKKLKKLNPAPAQPIQQGQQSPFPPRQAVQPTQPKMTIGQDMQTSGAAAATDDSREARLARAAALLKK
jgi:hypothetical protein